MNNILVVGEAFGKEEEKQGKAFVGPSGQLLRSALYQLGVDPESVTYTNVCMFRLVDKLGRNRVPTEDECLAGIQRLSDEFLDHEYVLALGKTAHMYCNYPTLEFAECLGLQQGICNNYVTTCWHPSAVLRNPSKYRKWLKQLSVGVNVSHIK